MALVECPECGHKISDRALACPGCGYPQREASGRGPITAADADEKVLLEQQPAFFRVAPGYVILSVILVPVVIGIFMLIGHYMKCSSQRLTITTRRVTFRNGLMNQQRHELRLRDVRSIVVTRTFFERLVGTGTIEVSSSATDGAEIIASGFPAPDEIAELIRSRQEH